MRKGRRTRDQTPPITLLLTCPFAFGLWRIGTSSATSLNFRSVFVDCIQPLLCCTSDWRRGFYIVGSAVTLYSAGCAAVKEESQYRYGDHNCNREYRSGYFTFHGLYCSSLGRCADAVLHLYPVETKYHVSGSERRRYTRKREGSLVPLGMAIAKDEVHAAAMAWFAAPP
jgi:hypothetical protein